MRDDQHLLQAPRNASILVGGTTAAKANAMGNGDGMQERCIAKAMQRFTCRIGTAGFEPAPA